MSMISSKTIAGGAGNGSKTATGKQANMYMGGAAGK